MHCRYHLYLDRIELVRVHLGNPHLETVLPQHTFSPVGLIA